MLRPGDKLFRKLNPDDWNPGSFEIKPEAFQDNHDDLSLYVARFVTPRQLLGKFAKMKGLREFLFHDRNSPRTPEELWEKGLGIGVISYDAIIALGLCFVKDSKGLEIDKEGHVDVEQGSEWMLELSGLARALAVNEVFPAV